MSTPPEPMDDQRLEIIVKRYDRDRSTCRIVSVQYEPVVQKGENYSSVFQRAKFRVVLGTGQETTKFAIIKKSIEVEGQVKLFDEWSVFKVETKIFVEVLSHMKRLMNEYQDHSDVLWCQLIGYNPYDTIILEDLKNFRLASRVQNLDLDHCLLVLKSLGRFDAMSRVLLSKGLISNDLNPMYLTSDSTFTSRIIKGALTQASNVIATSWSPEWKGLSSRIANGVEGSLGRLQQLAKINNNTYVVLNHGDIWTTNLMFKYSPFDETKPIAVRFIDFQLCHYNSYAWDIIYFIYSSVKPKVRREYFDVSLESYHKSLISTLEFYGEAEGSPTMDDVKFEINRLDYFAFMVQTCVYSVVSADTPNAFDMDKLGQEIEYVDAFNPEIFNSDNFKEQSSRN